jgi:hypothetical protein
MLELLKMENAIPRFKSSFEINYSAVAKNIRNELELPSSRKKTLTRWAHKYVADFW